MAKKRESRRQLKIRHTLEEAFPLSVWKKIHGGLFQDAGIPDLIGCVEGLFIALEIKEPDGSPSKIQIETIKDYQESGGFAAVVESASEAVEFVHQALAEAKARSRGRLQRSGLRSVLRTTYGQNLDHGRGHRTSRLKVSLDRRHKDQLTINMGKIPK